MSNEKSKSNKIWMITTVALVILLFGLVSAKNIGDTGSEAVEIIDSETYDGEIQKATLKFENFEYVLEPSTLKVGVPVEIEVDMSTVQGCMQAINIPAFGIEKYVTNGDNIITFTPDETGLFTMACSMNMGRGTFTVA
jgi:uncharacterized protein